MILAKIPLPVPLLVLVDKATVGLADVLQHTPRAVIIAPPSSVIFPPLVAVVDVMDVRGVVVRVGKVAATFSKPSSFWQLKAIMPKRIMEKKVFMAAVT